MSDAHDIEQIAKRLESVAWACARIGMSAQLSPTPSHRDDLLEMRDACQEMAVSVRAILPLLSAAEAKGAREPDGWRLAPVEPTDEILRSMLAVRFPATFKTHLRYPDSGPKSAAQDEREIQTARKQYAAALAAIPPIKEG